MGGSTDTASLPQQLFLGLGQLVLNIKCVVLYDLFFIKFARKTIPVEVEKIFRNRKGFIVFH